MAAPELPDLDRTPSPELPAGAPVVALVTPWIPQYRTGLYTLMRDQLAAEGVVLRLVQGNPYGAAAAKEDCITLPWAHVRDHRVLHVAGRPVTWQPVLDLTRDADLVIHDQQVARLVNYVFLAQQALGRTRFAFFGHGRNMQQGTASRLGETVKRLVSTRVHWWFPYNELSARVVEELGYPRERITPVMNAIDTRQLRADVEATTDDDLDELRAEHGIGDGPIGIYVGAMYAEKRLDLLVEAAEELRRRVPDFEMVFVGTGPDVGIVEAAAAEHAWVHALGPRFGADKARLLVLADVLLMPGAVGLVVLDAFVAGIPMATIANTEHGPEIDYLEHGVNGLHLPAETTAEAYAAAVAELLVDDERRRALVANGAGAADEYTIENMADRWARGILDALAAPPLRGA